MKTIGLLFDFDKTLARDSTSETLKQLGVEDIPRFWHECRNLAAQEGFDPPLEYIYNLIRYEREGLLKRPLTRETLKEIGRDMNRVLYPGVVQLVSDVKKMLAERRDVQADFIIISSGLRDVVTQIPGVAGNFEVFASELKYNDETGVAEFPLRVISATEKTRYYYGASKGLTYEDHRNDPHRVHSYMEPQNRRIQKEHMFFVGDGLTDIPALAATKQFGGYPVAVIDWVDDNALDRAVELCEKRGILSFEPKFTRTSPAGRYIRGTIKAIVDSIEAQRRGRTATSPIMSAPAAADAMRLERGLS